MKNQNEWRVQIKFVPKKKVFVSMMKWWQKFFIEYKEFAKKNVSSNRETLCRYLYNFYIFIYIWISFGCLFFHFLPTTTATVVEYIWSWTFVDRSALCVIWYIGTLFFFYIKPFFSLLLSSSNYYRCSMLFDQQQQQQQMEWTLFLPHYIQTKWIYLLQFFCCCCCCSVIKEEKKELITTNTEDLFLHIIYVSFYIRLFRFVVVFIFFSFVHCIIICPERERERCH
mgnify:CR=1 FL=1